MAVTMARPPVRRIHSAGGPAPRQLKRQLGERIFWRRSQPRWARTSQGDRAQSLSRLLYLSGIHAHFSLGTVCDRGERVCDVFGPDRGSHVLSANDWASESRVPSFPPRMHTCVRAQVAAEARYITTSFRRIDDRAFALSHDDMTPYFKEFWWP